MLHPNKSLQKCVIMIMMMIIIMIINRKFKQIATAGSDTAAGSKFPPKCDTVHVRGLHPAVVRNPTM